MTVRRWSILIPAAFLFGCGGHYILTVPDQLAPVGGDAVAVCRLQRNDFFVLSLPVKQAAVRLVVPGCQERAAYTDKLGYAGTTVPVPSQPGRYRMYIHHQDIEGEEVAGEVPLCVWDPGKAAVAVDLDCLPEAAEKESAGARAALVRLWQDANLLYLTRKDVSEHKRAHERLAAGEYPDGPVLTWRRQRWHIVRSDRLKLPQVVVESRLVSQLTELRKVLPNLNVGVCESALAAKAFEEAGMQCVIVGQAAAKAGNPTRVESWSQLAREGL